MTRNFTVKINGNPETLLQHIIADMVRDATPYVKSIRRQWAGCLLAALYLLCIASMTIYGHNTISAVPAWIYILMSVTGIAAMLMLIAAIFCMWYPSHVLKQMDRLDITGDYRRIMQAAYDLSRIVIVTQESHTWHRFSEAVLCIALIIGQPKLVQLAPPAIPDPYDETTAFYYDKDMMERHLDSLYLSHDLDKYRHIKFGKPENGGHILSLTIH